jgi:hypothetical protein
MAFSDPTGGAGYAQGAVLPPSHITYIADAVGKSLDKDGVDSIQGTITLDSGGTIDVTEGRIEIRDHKGIGWAYATLATSSASPVAVPGNRSHVKLIRDAAGNSSILLPDDGESVRSELHIWSDASVARQITLRKWDDSATIAVFPASTACAVSLISDGTTWRVFSWSGGPTSLQL